MGEILDVSLFVEGKGPVYLPLLPCLLVGWRLTPFVPCCDNVSALEGMIGSCGDHRGLGDGKTIICREVLALLLFDAVYSQWQAWVDG